MLRWILSLVAACLPALAAAQPYPAKPVKIIVPAQPGGGLDLIGRTVADQLGRAFQQSFLVENQGGGGGAIASMATARAAPDGYTLMVGYVATHAINAAMRKVPYDAIRDFTPVAMVGATRNILVVHPSLPVNDLKGFIEHSKSGKLNYGSGGPGTLTHLGLEQLKGVGAGVVYAHYRGIGPAIQDFLGGQIQALFPGLAAAMPHIRAKKMKPIAVTGLARHPLVLDVPTFEESGLKGFDRLQWYGIVGPAKLPVDITKRLNDEINKALASPALQQRLASDAIDPMPMSPEQFAAYLQADIAAWTAFSRERGIVLAD